MLDWAASVRGTSRPPDLDDLFELLARFVDRPIQEYRAFVDEFTLFADQIPSAAAAKQPLVANITLTLTVDETVSDPFSNELHRVFG